MIVTNRYEHHIVKFFTDKYHHKRNENNAPRSVLADAKRCWQRFCKQ